VEFVPRTLRKPWRDEVPAVAPWIEEEAEVPIKSEPTPSALAKRPPEKDEVEVVPETLM
jgi:hypothetical protein